MKGERERRCGQGGNLGSRKRAEEQCGRRDGGRKMLKDKKKEV